MKEFIFTWSIENFSYAWHRNGEFMVSPRFIAGPIHNSAWSLVLYPRGTENSDYLNLSLYRDKDGFPQDLSIDFEFSCISADNLVLHSCVVPKKFITFLKDEHYGYEESHFILRHDVFGRRRSSYLPKDILTLRCKMWIEAENGNEFDQKFGLTRLTTERIIKFRNINPANETKATFLIQSKCQNESLLSVHVLYFEDKIDVELKPKSKGNMKFSTLKFSCVHKRTRKKLCEYSNTFFDDLKAEKWRLPFSDKIVRTRNENDFRFIIEFVYSTGEEIKKLEEKGLLEEIQSSRKREYVSNYLTKFFTGGNATCFSSISQEICNLLTERCLCDVELKTQNNSFFVHKVVLCARSPVFSAMLTGEMKEKIKGRIEIEDISDKTLQIFLNFLYTDKWEGLDWDAAIELYYAADKYQVERLKRLCCRYLKENVRDDNFCELLVLADRHHDCVLRRKVYDFIWVNDEKIFRCPAWMTFACKQPQVAMKAMLSKYEEKESHGLPEILDNDLSSIPSIEDDFRSLYQGQIASDVVIKSKGSTFPAHKIVLSASSSSFREMLKDKSTDVLDLLQWEEDIISQMLSFLYTDSLEDIKWDSAMKLYQLANAHEIRRLQIKCPWFLLENLSVSNAINLLLVANDNQDITLKRIVEDYILVHDEEIFPSNEWAKFSKSNLLLANETMIAKYKQAK